jgi:hypothetical protein
MLAALQPCLQEECRLAGRCWHKQMRLQERAVTGTVCGVSMTW